MVVFHWKKLLFAIIVLALVLRIWHVGDVPPGVTNDEASYIYNAYSVWKTGKDITGKLLPLSINLDNSFSPVPVYLYAPFVGIFGLSPFVGRLPVALAGTVSVFFLFLITRNLTGKTPLALLSGLVLAISPWHIQFSRTAYENGLALFFFLMTMVIFLHLKKTWRALWCLIPLLLSFYSYHGTKIFLVAFVPMFFLHATLKKHITWRQYGALLTGFLVIIISFLIVIKTQNVNRQLIFLWNNINQITATVKNERMHNTAPMSLQPVFNNKVATLVRLVRENYLQVFSSEFLFLYGEVGGLNWIYGTGFRGVLYSIEFPLILLGLLSFYKRKHPLLGAFLMLGIFTAPLPSAFTIDKSYAARSIMLLPFLAVLTAQGIETLIEILKRQKQTVYYGCIVIFILLYGYLFLGYLYQYYFRYPVYAAETWFSSSKDLAQYLRDHEHQYQIIQIANPGDLLIQLAIHLKLEPELVSRLYKTPSPKSFGKVTMISGCIDTHGKTFFPETYLTPHTLYITKFECHQEATPSATITDRGEKLRTIWKIYERN